MYFMCNSIFLEAIDFLSICMNLQRVLRTVEKRTATGLISGLIDVRLITEYHF